METTAIYLPNGNLRRAVRIFKNNIEVPIISTTQSEAAKSVWLTDTVFRFNPESPILWRAASVGRTFERLTSTQGAILSRFRKAGWELH